MKWKTYKDAPDETVAKRTAFISNIPNDLKHIDLLEHFSKAGKIVGVELPLERSDNQLKDDQGYHHVREQERHINFLEAKKIIQ